MPAFQFRHIKNLYPTFWGKSAEMVQAVTSLIEEEERKTGSKGTTIEFAGWLSRCTLDIIGIAGLGYKFKALEQPDNEVNQAYRRVFTPSKQAKMLAVAGMVFPPITPLLRLLPVQRNEDIAASASTIRAVSRKIIEEKQRRLSEKGTSDIDILSVALGSGGFSIENLVDQTMTFLAAGHETTATSTTWAVYALCNNPKMQERLRAEIRSALPSPNENVQMTPELIDHLPYLNAFCNEVLRFYAPVPFTRRVAAKDTSISGQFIPKDTHVILVPSAINVSKELWGEDADVFNPERWMAPKQANSGGAVSNYANLTFLHGKPLGVKGFACCLFSLLTIGLGPRSCIGLSFAKAEFACLLATIAGRFKMDLAPELKGKDLEMEVSIVRKPKNGLKVQMEVVEGW